MQNLVNVIIDLFSGLTSLKYGRELIVFLISASPILELRGMVAGALLGLKPLVTFLVSFIGNIIPVPFILIFIAKILEWMGNCKIKLFRKIAKYLHKKANKNRSKIDKYGYIGLILLVGVPLPGTGAWTGCLVAGLLNMDRKKSFLSVVLGVLLASAIMMIFSYGILNNLVN